MVGLWLDYGMITITLILPLSCLTFFVVLYIFNYAIFIP